MRDEHRDDGGFTLVELLVAIVLFGIVVGLAVAPYSAYRTRQQHIGTARELVAFLRRAQVRSVAEEVQYRVTFTASSATMYRANGAAWTVAQTTKPSTSSVTYANASFQPASGGGATASVTFYAKGSADRGSVTVVRSGSSKTYRISVEGLTARVSYS